MKILVFSPGVIGSFYASRLCARHDVTLLARGRRLEYLRENGLRLVNEDTGEEERHALPVVERLDPQDRYDVVLVSMRCQQAQEILPALRENCSPAVVFLMNGVTSYDEWHAALGDRMLTGFPILGGEVRDGVARYAPGVDKRGSPAKTHLGAPAGGSLELLRRVAGAFAECGLPVDIVSRMRDYHITHAALVCPLANALYKCNGSNYELAANPAVVREAFLSVRECLRALRGKGVAITPGSMRLLAWMPLRLAVRMACKTLATPHVETVAARHARNARDEMKRLYEELMDFIGDSGVELRETRELGKYLLN